MSSIKTFEKRPAKVQAIFHDGSLESAKEVAKGINSLGIGTEIVYHSRRGPNGPEDHFYVHYAPTEGYGDQRHKVEKRVFSNTWWVFAGNEEFTMDIESFDEHYVGVPNTEDTDG